MTFASFWGCFLIGVGPGIALFVTIISQKSFLVIVTFSSAFFWLLTLISVAALWRPFVPLGDSIWPLVLLLCTVIVVQEAARLLFWRIYCRVETGVNSISVAQGRPLISPLERMQVALAGGLGHGGVHSAIFFLSLLTPSLGPATYYSDKCSHMPFFLNTALLSLAVLLQHIFGMVIAFDAFHSKSRERQLFVPAIHLISAFLMLINLSPGGCSIGMPLVWVCTLPSIVLSAKIVWEQTVPLQVRAERLSSVEHQSLQSSI